MTTALSIRSAGVEDIAALQELYCHLSPDDAPCPPDIARKVVSDLQRYAGSGILIGHLGDTVVCSCTLIVIPNLTRGGRPYALIENVVTHGAYRNKGFGTSILDAASERAWAHGCYKIMLSTGSHTPSILSFYTQAGFTQSRTGFQKRRVAPRLE